MVAKLDEANESCNMSRPPVVPNQLIKMSYLEFCKVFVTQKELMTAAGWTAADIDAIKRGRSNLLNSVEAERALENALKSCKNGVSFDDGRFGIRRRFRFLHCLVGEIASMFSGLSQVENDFLIVRGERDEFRRSVTDLSLERVLHRMQFNMLDRYWESSVHSS